MNHECDSFERALEAALYPDLSDGNTELAAEVARHVEVCAPCAALLRWDVRVVAALRDSTAVAPVPPALPNALVEAILATRRSRPTSGARTG